MAKCTKCNGTGYIKIVTKICCGLCRGTGQIDIKIQNEEIDKLELLELREFKRKILECVGDGK